MQLKLWFDKNRALLISLIVYLISGIIITGFCRYGLNDDGISYITIAKKYLNGDYKNAVNGYWGPLYSILLVPFLYFNIEPLLSAKILNLIAGGFVIVGGYKILIKLELSNVFNFIVMLILAITILSYVYSYITPDLLLFSFLIFYINLLMGGKYLNKKGGFWAGILGGISYLAKNYALGFFLLHYIIFNVYFYFKNKSNRKTIIVNFISGLLVFALISGIWICFISSKYGYFTIGTAGKYNIAITNPQVNDKPILWDVGLTKPPNDTALSAWEDISYTQFKTWSPFSSYSDFRWEMFVIMMNIIKLMINPEHFIIIFVLFGLTYLLIKKKNAKNMDKAMYLLLTALMFYSGYLLFINIEYRYVWINEIILIILSGFLIEKWIEGDCFTKTIKYIIFIWFVFIFSCVPIYSLANSFNFNSQCKNFMLEAQTLRNDYKVSGNIATNGSWHYSMYISYFANYKFYGMPKMHENKYSIDELKNNNIDYFFVLNETDYERDMLKGYKYLTLKNEPKLKIYIMK